MGVREDDVEVRRPYFSGEDSLASNKADAFSGVLLVWRHAITARRSVTSLLHHLRILSSAYKVNSKSEAQQIRYVAGPRNKILESSTASFFVHAQQRAQLLLQRRVRHHPPAVTQREREAPHLPLLPFHLQRSQAPPSPLALACPEASRSAAPTPCAPNCVAAAV